jgi:hypothetical protein
MAAGGAESRLPGEFAPPSGGEDEMTFKSCCMAAPAALLFMMPASASAQDQHQYSVRNDIGRTVVCGLRKAGSSAIEDFTLKAGAIWTKAYSGPKQRLLVCEGDWSRWQTLAPDRPYRILETGDDRIIAEMISGH